MGLLLMIGMLAMILDSRTALQGASQGVELCLTAVIPSEYQQHIQALEAQLAEYQSKENSSDK